MAKHSSLLSTSHWSIPPPPSAKECEDITTAIENDALVACSDSAYNRQLGVGSQAWIFGDNIGTFLSSGAGPTDGGPKFLSSYRAELSGLLCLMYILHCICNHYDLHNHKVTLHCDSKSALTNILKDPKPGITPFLKTDYDLLEVAQLLLTVIPLVVLGEWVKGHYAGKHRKSRQTT
jgi:hypothetical protein